jgi:hypothetical protein
MTFLPQSARPGPVSAVLAGGLAAAKLPSGGQVAAEVDRV